MPIDLKNLIGQSKGKKTVKVHEHVRHNPSGKTSLVDEYLKYVDLNDEPEDLSSKVDKNMVEDSVDIDVENRPLPDPEDEDYEDVDPNPRPITVLEQAQLPKVDPKEINDLIRNWKTKRDEDSMRRLIDHHMKIIYFNANKYKTNSIPYNLVVLKGKALLVKAADTYDPNKGAKFNTHLTNYLRKLTRFVNDSANIAKIPEQRSRKITAFKHAKATLEVKLNREPTEIELSDHLSWPIKEIHRMVKELEAGAEILNFGEGTSWSDLGISSSKIHSIVNLVYHDSNPEEQFILEHTTDIAGKKQLSTQEIAKKLKLPESKVKYMLSNIKKRIVENL